MQDPNPPSRAQQYLDFEHIARYRFFQHAISNPAGTLTAQLKMDSPFEEPEADLKRKFDLVEWRFRRGNSDKLWDHWYCMPTRNLANELGRDAEYRFWYTFLSGWAHGDPMWTKIRLANVDPQPVFILAGGYYARMLLLVGRDAILTSDQFKALERWAAMDTLR